MYIHDLLSDLGFFFFNDTATTEIYTLSLHDALPISASPSPRRSALWWAKSRSILRSRSEEHTSELQSHVNLVCRLLLEKKKLVLLLLLPFIILLLCFEIELMLLLL